MRLRCHGATHENHGLVMKIRESGMPDESMWADFFDPDVVLSKLGITASCGTIVEFGCGYGTFTIPTARIVSGMVHAFDIAPEMMSATQAKADAARLDNVHVCLRDFVAQGTGLPDASADYAMLFNILHTENPDVLLREAFRILVSGGTLGIAHWNYDETTPRGPSMSIRPRPEQCLEWAQAVGFHLIEPGIIDLPPYHYGIALRRPAARSGHGS